MLDLYNNKYNMDILKKHIYGLNLIDILKTQKIDVTFAAKYILNKKYQLTPDEEDNINVDFVIQLQPHISKHLLVKELLLYDSDDDSIDNFEIISNK